MTIEVNLTCVPAFVISLLLASAAFGQAGSVAPPAPPVLEGPKVDSVPARESLVHRDMSGMMQPLDVRPEQAALDLLGLSPEQREPVDAFLEERGKATARLVSDNYELVLRLANAFQSGTEQAELAPLLREFYPVARDLLEPPLQSRIAEQLPDAFRARFNALVDEYKLEAARDFARRTGAPAPDGNSLSPMQQRRTEGYLLLKEVGASIRGTVSDLQSRADEFLKRIQATPEQESTIRAAFQNSRNLLRPTPEERRAMMRQIWPILTPEQRQILLRSRDE